MRFILAEDCKSIHKTCLVTCLQRRRFSGSLSSLRFSLWCYYSTGYGDDARWVVNSASDLIRFLPRILRLLQRHVAEQLDTGEKVRCPHKFCGNVVPVPAHDSEPFEFK